jgi:hypothetical protein
VGNCFAIEKKKETALVMSICILSFWVLDVPETRNLWFFWWCVIPGLKPVDYDEYRESDFYLILFFIPRNIRTLDDNSEMSNSGGIGFYKFKIEGEYMNNSM